MFELAQVRALQQLLVLLDRAADLPLLAIQVAEDQVDLERIAGAAAARVSSSIAGSIWLATRKFRPSM